MLLIAKRSEIPCLALRIGCLGVLMGMLLVLAHSARVGAAGPAVLVKDINPGPASALTVSASLVGVRDQLFFNANNGADGEALWRSDGTEAGTTPIAGFLSLSSLVNVNDTLFFAADDGVHGYELWKSDGTPAGTTMVADVFPGQRTSYPEYLTSANGTLFFYALDPLGWGLWKSDGSAAGTISLKRHTSSLSNLINVNGTLYYLTDEGDGAGNWLWRSDGTAEGTILLKTFPTVPLPDPNIPLQLSIRSLTAVGQRLFFVAYSSGRGYELWQSDGSAAGTLRVSDSGPQTTGVQGLWFLQNMSGTLFMLIDRSQQSTALWKSDGTAAGTVLVKEFAPGTAAADITSISTMANVNGKLVFAVYPASFGAGDRDGAIWTSDGTAAGTVVIKEHLKHMLAMSVACGKLYFSGRPTISTADFQGWELWQSDGTAAGTIQVQDIAPGPADSIPMQITTVARQLFFSADDGTSGRELWALPITHIAPIGPTPALFLPHQIFLPHTQSDVSC